MLHFIFKTEHQCFVPKSVYRHKKKNKTSKLTEIYNFYDIYSTKNKLFKITNPDYRI